MGITTSSFAEMCWSQCWQVTALILVVALLGSTVLKRRPHILHLLWMLVFVKSLTLPLWSSPTGVFSWLQARPQPTQPFDYDDRYLDPVSPSIEPDRVADAAGEYDMEVAAAAEADSASGEGGESGQMVLLRREKEPSPAQAAASRPGALGSVFSGNAWTLFCVLWISGALLLLALVVRRWCAVYRLLKDSYEADSELHQAVMSLARKLRMSRRVRVLISKSNVGPMVFGAYRPTLILPEALMSRRSVEEIEPILIHELLHARRGDTIFGALQLVAQIVWWFHPLVWWAARKANRVCERCCDEEVMANLRCKPGAYARCLLDVLELRARLTVAPGIPGIRSVDVTTDRMEKIMSNSDLRRPLPSWRYWALAVILAVVILPGSGMLLNAWQEPGSVAPPATDVMFLRHEAEQAAADKEWKLAAEKFQAILDQDDNDARAWFMLGYVLHADGRLDEAIKAHKRATTFPGAKRVALYNLACAYALKGEKTAALQTLKQAVDAGFVAQSPVLEDSDFSSLKDDPDFIKLAESAKPLPQREIYRQFDFWVGTWDVYGRKGQKVGTNVITKDERGFLLTEKWTNATGGTGTSINYYDPSAKKWKQTWVDAGGTVVQYEGGFENGKMSLNGQLKKPNGEVVWSRVSFSTNDDGTLRQLVEHSQDQGSTWKTYFDGKYVRQGASKES